MNKPKIIAGILAAMFLMGCEQAKDFHYYIENSTGNKLNVFVEYSISARGKREADTLNILPGEKELVFSHSGLGGFYTGAIEQIRFSGRDTLKQEWRNRSESQINKHFFRRNSWKLLHRDDNSEHYLFNVKPTDLKIDS